MLVEGIDDLRKDERSNETRARTRGASVNASDFDSSDWEERESDREGLFSSLVRVREHFGSFRVF